MFVYLDSSAVIKRYLEENGSAPIDALYDGLEAEEGNVLAFSVWNVGEVLGAMDTRHSRGDLDDAALTEAVGLFAQETKKLVAMRKLRVLPMSSEVFSASWDLVLKHHIYQGDALQIATTRQMRADILLSADRKLVECAKKEEIQTANPEIDADKIATLVRPKKQE